MANGAAIGPTNAEINQLPLQSPTSAYDLRNASVAIGTPQPLPPPEMTPEQSIQELQQNATASFLRPQVEYQSQYQPDFQQQQFQQPDFQAPSPHSFQPAIDAIAAQYQQQNAERGKGVARHLFSTFLGGMGRAMMHNYGLLTPEEEQDRRLQKIVELSNAQSQQDLRNVEMQRYALDIQRVPVIGSDGQPLTDGNGQPRLYPRWQARNCRSITTAWQNRDRRS
jgi:hypothetical protein